MAPGAWHLVETVGVLRGRIFRVLMAVPMPGLETVMVSVEPALKGFLSSFLRETSPLALVFLKPLAETVAPVGTPRTINEVSVVCFLVESLKVNVTLTRIWGADLDAAFRPGALPLAAAAGAGTTVKVRLAEPASTLPAASVAWTSKA